MVEPYRGGGLPQEGKDRLGARGLVVFFLAAGYFLWTEHRTHELGRRFPQLDLFSHESGHLWHTLFGWEGDPHFDPFHVASYV